TDAGGAPVEGAVVDLVGTGKSYVTNGEGWFSDMLVPKGTWDLRVTVGDRSALLEDAAPTEAECSEETYAFNLYTDYRLTITIEEADGIAKPNIYIYPTEVTEVSVKLSFPAGGLVTVSDPPYGDGWRVTVTPEGTINGEHTFLFYEGRSGGAPLQRSQGWIVKREELEGFFRKNLAVTGFYEQEIEDFVEFWVPHLTDHPYFALHPQYNAIYGEIVSLDVEPEPHSLIRLAYVIEGLEEEMELMPAEIPAFEAGGFTVHEWGVILSPADVSAYLY
ncbi:carboxypeptidase regulatory-like domain-containing protein, partial [bacterium]|nr:carboxypeptidase regulatory-like domain-containing protein [bacterium]